MRRKRMGYQYFDSECSHTLNPLESDVVGPITPIGKVMNGLGATVNIVGIGVIGWTFRDDYGVMMKVFVKAYHIPESKIRLFSPQQYFEQEVGGSFMMNGEGSKFTFHNGGISSFQYVGSKLPISMASIVKVPSSAGYLVSTGRKNVSKAQEELLLWHSTLDHYNIANNQKLMTSIGVDTEPLLIPKDPGIATCSLPLCVSFLRGKGRVTSVKSTTETLNPEPFDIIKNEHFTPGDTVSIDQYECRVKGLLSNTRGREDPAKKYCGGTLFNDHASSKIDVFHQISLGASDTIRSKELYEQQAEEVVVNFLAYRGDNGVYKSKGFKDDLIRRGQTMTYSGVGAHEQNGVAERGIPTIVNSARTMMLH